MTITRYIAKYERSDSLTGAVVETHYSRPLHCRSLTEARAVAWECDTYLSLLERDQRWTLAGLSAID